MDWPFPDNKEQRHKRILESYRYALFKVDPAVCRTLDEQMAQFGQTWIAGSELVDVHAYKSAREIAEQFDLNVWDIRNWARRHPDRIAQRKDGGRSLFLVGDVLKYQAQ